MRRSDFIGSLAALVASSATSGAQPRAARIGWLTTGPSSEVSPFLAALRAGLADRGYVEGRNLTIVERYADGDIERVPALAEELANAPVDLITTQGSATRLLQKVSARVPVVYVFSADPVLAGIADTLARPARNMTGISVMSIELNGKRIELLREIMPKLDRIAIVASPIHAGEELERNNSVEMAKRLGITVQYFPTPTTAELRRAYVALKADPPQAIVVFPDPITFSNRTEIAGFARELGIPVVSGWADFADAGALCSYGPKLAESYRRLAYYVERILKGEKAANLPVERPNVFELVVNLKAARAIGLDVPQALLSRADRVIE